MRANDCFSHLLALSGFVTEAVLFVTAWETDGCKVDKRGTGEW